MSYFCYQGNNGDCGFAALKMMMATFAHNKSYLYIKKTNKRKDFTFLDLRNIAKRYGFQISAYNITDKDLSCLEAPFLAKLNTNHLVMVKKIKKSTVVVYDPDSGIQKINIDDFKNKWTGECLERDENSIPNKINIKQPILMSKKHQYFLAIFMIVIAAILLTGFYFIKEDSNFILVIGLLALFVICELVENWYLIKRINSFDKQYIPLYFNKAEDRDYEHYKGYVDFKKDYFKSKKSILASFLIAIVLCVLLSINDAKNLLVFAIILIAQITDKLVFRNKQKKKENEINEIESKAFDEKTCVIENLLKANTLASSFGLSITARKTVFAFLIAVISVLMMVFNNLISTNYVLFHFGAYYVISNSFDSVFDYIFNYEKGKKMHARFIDQCNL